MDNHGNTPDQSPNSELQSPKKRRGAKGHTEPTSIMRTSDLSAMGGGSTEIHGNQRKPNGFSDPKFVSANDIRAQQMEVGNTEYPAEMMAEQKENQDRNQLRRTSTQTNKGSTSEKL